MALVTLGADELPLAWLCEPSRQDFANLFTACHVWNLPLSFFAPSSHAVGIRAFHSSLEGRLGRGNLGLLGRGKLSDEIVEDNNNCLLLGSFADCETCLQLHVYSWFFQGQENCPGLNSR